MYRAGSRSPCLLAQVCGCAAVQGGFSYSGQRCTAVKVVLVMEEVADELVRQVNEGVEGLTVGMPEVSATVCWLWRLASEALAAFPT